MVLFDMLSAQPNGATKYHGGGEYIKTIFSELVLRGFSKDITLYFDREKYLDEWILRLISKHDIAVEYVKGINDMYALLNTGRFDCFYSGLPSYWLDRSRIKSDATCIGTVHGLRTVECPCDEYTAAGNGLARNVKNRVKLRLRHQLAERNWEGYETCLSSLNHVITDSEHSAYAIRNMLHSAGDLDLTVCYPPMKHVEEKEVPIHGLEGETFVLLVSGNRWEKNPYRAMKALADLSARGKLDGVKVVGCGYKGTPAGRLVEGDEHFVLLGYVDAGELEWLYRNCSVFFYPTLNEGFGYPPLEAMKYGKTCVVSGVCSVPEVCGAAVYYTNPYDLLEMQTRILEALGEPLSSDVVLRRFDEVGAIQKKGMDTIVSLIMGDA